MGRRRFKDDAIESVERIAETGGGAQRRKLEQTILNEQFGGKHGPGVLNKRNPVAPKFWDQLGIPGSR